MSISLWLAFIRHVGVELCHNSKYNYHYDKETGEKEEFTGLKNPQWQCWECPAIKTRELSAEKKSLVPLSSLIQNMIREMVAQGIKLRTVHQHNQSNMQARITLAHSIALMWGRTDRRMVGKLIRNIIQIIIYVFVRVYAEIRFFIATCLA